MTSTEGVRGQHAAKASYAKHQLAKGTRARAGMAWSMASKGDNIMLPCTDWQLSKAKSASQMQGHTCKTSQDTKCQKCWGRSNMPSPLQNKHTSSGFLAFWGTLQTGDISRCPEEEEVVWEELSVWDLLPASTKKKKKHTTHFTPVCYSFPAITDSKWPPLGENFPCLGGY